MHLQETVTGWTEGLVRMPDMALLKAVGDPAILTDGVAKWTAAGRDRSKLHPSFRYADYEYPDWNRTYTWEELCDLWRRNIRKFVDGTYLLRHVSNVKSVAECNEYTDTRMVTNKELLAPRIASARAFVHVWNTEYRGRVIQVEGVEAMIPADCRPVICDSPVGNDIPIEYFQLAVDEDAILGVHAYTKWWNKVRDAGDFRWHSGRFHFNEQAYGIKPLIMISESGPYNGSTDGGWRHTSCMGGDEELLKQGMTAWFKDLATTDAYKEGRLIGPGAWFTTSNDKTKWQYYKLYKEQLVDIANIAMDLWHPGSSVPPEPPVPSPTECRGKPRVDYKREYWVLHGAMTDAQQDMVFGEAKKIEIDENGYPVGHRTVGWSPDDACIGDLSRRLVTFWNYPLEDHQVFREWVDEFYPGVAVSFEHTDDIQDDWEIFDIVDDLPTNPDKSYLSRPLAAITTLTIHHTVGGAYQPVENIASYHINTNGWPGIGYHFVIDGSGKIYQVNRLTTKSYHAGSANAPGDENYWSAAISLQGNFHSSPPPWAQQEAARWLVKHLQTELGRSLDVLPHRGMPGAQTECPGDTWEGWFPYVAGG